MMMIMMMMLVVVVVVFVVWLKMELLLGRTIGHILLMLAQKVDVVLRAACRFVHQLCALAAVRFLLDFKLEPGSSLSAQLSSCINWHCLHELFR